MNVKTNVVAEAVREESGTGAVLEDLFGSPIVQYSKL